MFELYERFKYLDKKLPEGPWKTEAGFIYDKSNNDISLLEDGSENFDVPEFVCEARNFLPDILNVLSVAARFKHLKERFKQGKLTEYEVIELMSMLGSAVTEADENFQQYLIDTINRMQKEIDSLKKSI